MTVVEERKKDLVWKATENPVSAHSRSRGNVIRDELSRSTSLCNVCEWGLSEKQKRGQDRNCHRNIFTRHWVRLVLCNSLPQNFRAKNFAGCRHTLAVSVDNQDIKELMVILKEQELWEVVSATCVKA